jgi:hypothetical protein
MSSYRAGLASVESMASAIALKIAGTNGKLILKKKTRFIYKSEKERKV